MVRSRRVPRLSSPFPEARCNGWQELAPPGGLAGFLHPTGQAIFAGLVVPARWRAYTLVNSWELLSGIVRANYELEQTRAAQGKASLVGLTEDQIAPALQGLSAVSRKSSIS